MSRQQNLCLVLPLLSACVGWAASRIAPPGANPPVSAWKAQLFDTIPPAKSDVEGQQVKLSLMPGAIRYESKGRNNFEIPFSSVLEINHEMTTYNLGGLIFDAIMEGYKAHTCSNDCVIGLMLVPLFAPFQLRAHYVTVAWRDDSDVRRAVFRLRKREYRSFMESVSAVSGQPYRDLAEEQQKIRRALKRQLKSGITVRLEHEVALGDVLLKRRVYKMLLAESQTGSSQVSFFAGEKSIVTMPVDIGSGRPVRSAEVSYIQSQAGDWIITEVRIPGRILRFPSPGPNPAPDLTGGISPSRGY